MRKRAGLLKLLERVERGNVSVVAVYDQSRGFRNTTDALTFYSLMEKRPEIKVAFVKGSFDRTPVGEFTYTTLAAAHAMERRMTGEKTKDAYAFLNAKGIPTGPAPYGYRYVEVDGQRSRSNGKLEPDPDTAPVVCRIFEDYASGQYTTTMIAEALTNEGVPPSNSRSGLWMADTIAGMLSNVAYIGKTYSISRLKRRGEIIEARWPAIIEDGLYQRVQDRLKVWKTPVTRGKAKRKREFAFRGLLWCQKCGQRFAAQHTHGVNYYYCGSREANNKDCDHALHAIREDALTPWVDDLVGTFLVWGHDKADKLLHRKEADKATATQAIARIDAQIARVGTRFQVGELDEDGYRAELERLRRQRAAYVVQAAERPSKREIDSLTGLWFSEDTAKRHEALTNLFERLYVRDREIVGYQPRADKADRVRQLVDVAVSLMRSGNEDGDGAADGPGANSARSSGLSGGGGI